MVEDSDCEDNEPRYTRTYLLQDDGNVAQSSLLRKV